MKQQLRLLRSQLPHRYAALIARRCDGITVRQVHAVFNGEITNTDIVEQVLTSAIDLKTSIERRHRQVLKTIRSSANMTPIDSKPLPAPREKTLSEHEKTISKYA